MKPINYTRIAMDDIHPEARRIAISWMEGWEEWMKSDIRHKVKLASDIQNFAIAYHQHELAQLQQHSVMQAEGSDVSEGAAVGQRSVDTVAEAWVCCGKGGLIDGTFYCDRLHCINDTRGGSAKGQP
jgi:hypothetical protein